MSGMDFKDEHPENIPNIIVTFFVFHLDISGNKSKDLQSLNNIPKVVTLLIFHLVLSIFIYL